ncbi:hypothetical protein LCGC14_0579400 [marine sediment metagenome]|uniref:Uncharacterized protein n=1 Tax=marine sediment metagenome TaxID=412755 RepID=A0A0F9RGU9_9ZZZZ
MMNGIKINIKELIAIIVFVATISGMWVRQEVKQGYVEKEINRIEKNINEELTKLNARADDIYKLLAD